MSNLIDYKLADVGEGIAEAYLLFKVTYALYYRIQELEEFLLNLSSWLLQNFDHQSAFI